MKPIVTLTMNPALDIATRVEKLIADQKLRCYSASQDPGGGINVARALLRLAGRTIALYPCDGKTGERLQELLAQENIPQQPIPIAQPIREDFLVHEDASGQDYRFVLPGPTLRESEWRHCLAQLAELARQADYIVASGSLPQGVPVDFYAQVARLTKVQEARLILDTSGAALHEALAEGIYQQISH
jgi:6-phosphofructokinase 2